MMCIKGVLVVVVVVVEICKCQESADQSMIMHCLLKRIPSMCCV